MDYDAFDKLLNKKGLNSEPAFENVLVQISPLPRMQGNPLGLYYSEEDPMLNVKPGTIWIPPESDDQTALHELGHRYYHFHAGDLSEESAEFYRHKYSSPSMYMATDTSGDSNNSGKIIFGILGGLLLTGILFKGFKNKNRY